MSDQENHGSGESSTEQSLVPMKTQQVEGITFGFVEADDKPRVRDIHLGNWLDFERPRDIRKLIRRHEESCDLGHVLWRATVARQATGFGERAYEVEEAWLTQEQALFIAAKCDTSKGNAVLKEVIRVFLLIGQGVAPALPSKSLSLVIMREEAAARIATLGKGILADEWIAKQLSHSIAVVRGDLPENDGPSLLDVSTYLTGKGHSATEAHKLSGVFGKAAKAAYKTKHGADPGKAKRMINGSERLVYCYTEDDLPVLDEAYETMMAKRKAKATLPPTPTPRASPGRGVSLSMRPNRYKPTERDQSLLPGHDLTFSFFGCIPVSASLPAIHGPAQQRVSRWQQYSPHQISDTSRARSR